MIEEGGVAGELCPMMHHGLLELAWLVGAGGKECP